MQYMLHSRRKAEIEVLYTQNKFNDSGNEAFGKAYPCSNSNPILKSHSCQSYYRFKSKSASPKSIDGFGHGNLVESRSQ